MPRNDLSLLPAFDALSDTFGPDLDGDDFAALMALTDDHDFMPFDDSDGVMFEDLSGVSDLLDSFSFDA